jgi:quercetin dioxygenase-like cupin family protein
MVLFTKALSFRIQARSETMNDLAADPRATEWLGVRYKTILSAERTKGAISIVDSWSPAGSGPPRHVHEKEDETFVILSGACKVWVEGEERTAAAGESVFIPRGTNHTFKVLDEGPSRHLVILTPEASKAFSPRWQRASSASLRTWRR